MSRRVGLVVGDTPGHFFPAVAVAQALQRRASTDVLMFGPSMGAAATLAQQCGYPFQSVRASAIARQGAIGVAAAAVRTMAGIAEARTAIRRAQLQLVVAFGGYASGAVVLAARSCGCGTVIHEANAVPGIANRLLGRVADRVCVSEWTSRAPFRPERTTVTGWPVRDEMNQLSAEPRSYRDGDSIRLLVSSGSRGGDFMATHVPAVVERLQRTGLTIEVRHQAADADCAAILRRYAACGVSADVAPSITDMAAAYRWATCAITRAGAGTISELALAGLPAVLVPLADAADKHQHENAKLYAAAGAARCIAEDEWRDEDVTETLKEFVVPDAAARASRAARAMATPRAAESVAEVCEQLMRGRW